MPPPSLKAHAVVRDGHTPFLLRRVGQILTSSAHGDLGHVLDGLPPARRGLAEGTDVAVHVDLLLCHGWIMITCREFWWVVAMPFSSLKGHL